jgi:hypothetical protein
MAMPVDSVAGVTSSEADGVRLGAGSSGQFHSRLILKVSLDPACAPNPIMLRHF